MSRPADLLSSEALASAGTREGEAAARGRTGRPGRVGAALLCLAVLAVGAPGAGAQTTITMPELPSGKAGEDLRRYAPSVVRVDVRAVEDGRTVETLGARRVGSGVLLDARTVLTIGYLVVEADAVTITTGSGRGIPASVLAYDHGSGFGLVRTALPVDGRPLELGDSDAVGEKQRVLTIGHGEPEATPLVVVSRRPFAGSWEYLCEQPLHTFPPVNNWSGSALISEDGKLIGIGSLMLNAAAERQGVPGNLFVPVNLLKPIMAELLANGRTLRPQPWLGLTTEVVDGRLTVVRVSAGSPADQAGIAPGDVVLSVGDDRVSDQATFYRSVWKRGPAGTTVPLKLLKSGSERMTSVRSIDRNEFLRKPTGI